MDDDWEYVGQCAECGAPLYYREGVLRPGRTVEPGHLCHLEGNEDYE
jgi:hypothetical protein